MSKSLFDKCMDSGELELPEICTPKYQEMMRVCMVKRAEGCMGYDQPVTSSSNRRWYGGIGVGVVGLVVVLGVFWWPSNESVGAGQVYAQDLVEEATSHSSDEQMKVMLLEAMGAGDLKVIAIDQLPERRGRSQTALSSAASYRRSSGGQVVMGDGEFRVNVFPGQLVNSRDGMYGGMQFVRFTRGDGGTVTIGIDVSRGVVQSVWVGE